jgi:hypothetical protein
MIRFIIPTYSHAQIVEICSYNNTLTNKYKEASIIATKEKEERDQKNRYLNSINAEITTEKFLKSNIESQFIEIIQLIFGMLEDHSEQKPEEKPVWDHIAVRCVSNVISLADIPKFETWTKPKQHIIHALCLIKALNSLRHPIKTIDNSIQDLLLSLKNF